MTIKVIDELERKDGPTLAVAPDTRVRVTATYTGNAAGKATQKEVNDAFDSSVIGHAIQGADGVPVAQESVLEFDDLTVTEQTGKTQVNLITARQLWASLLPQKGASSSLVIIGDSVTVGTGGTVIRDNGWGAILTDQLYGAQTENTTDGEIQSNLFEGLVLGPSTPPGSGTTGPLKMSAVLAVNTYIQFTGSYGFVDVFYETSVGAGTLSITVDTHTDPPYRTIDCNAASAHDVCSYDGTTTTPDTNSHQYRITATGGSCEITGLIRIGTAPSDGRLYINRMASSGYSTKDFTDATQLLSVTKQGGFKNFNANVTLSDGHVVSNPGSFYVIFLGLNDAFYISGAETKKTTPTEYEMNLVGIMRAIVANNANNRIAIMIPYVPNTIPLSLLYDYPFGQYVEAARRAGTSFGAVIADCSTVDFISEGLLAADGLHPNDNGHMRIYQIFARAVCESYGRHNMQSQYLLQQSNATSGVLNLLQPTFFVERPSAGNAIFTPISSYVAKLDNYDVTGYFTDCSITTDYFGGGTIDESRGLTLASIIRKTGTVLKLLKGWGNFLSLASGASMGQWRQFWGAAKSLSGSLDTNIMCYCPELKTATTTNAYQTLSVGPNTQSYHAGKIEIGGTPPTFNADSEQTAAAVPDIILDPDGYVDAKLGFKVNGVLFKSGRAFEQLTGSITLTGADSGRAFMCYSASTITLSYDTTPTAGDFFTICRKISSNTVTFYAAGDYVRPPTSLTSTSHSYNVGDRQTITVLFDGDSWCISELGTHPITDHVGVGTAAAKNIPASGNASTSEVVYGTDTRLTDARPPTAHTHNPMAELYFSIFNGTGYVPVAITGCVDDGTGLVKITAASHGLSTGNWSWISNIGGVSGTQAVWQVTVIDANNFTLDNSVFSGTYTSGGTTHKGTKTTSWTTAYGSSSYYTNSTANGTIQVVDAGDYEVVIQGTMTMATARTAIFSVINLSSGVSTPLVTRSVTSAAAWQYIQVYGSKVVSLLAGDTIDLFKAYTVASNNWTADVTLTIRKVS